MTNTNLDLVIDIANIVPNVTMKDSTEAIRRLGAAFLNTGYIKEEYIDAVLEREKIYPTGLKTVAGYVAIPHADSINVLKSGLAIATLNSAVCFKSMEDGIEEFPVTIVIMLAIKDPGSMVSVLQRVVSIMKSEKALNRINSANDASEIKEIVSSHLEIYEENSD
jgi:PTS system galactitol-specific IIA component